MIINVKISFYRTASNNEHPTMGRNIIRLRARPELSQPANGHTNERLSRRQLPIARLLIRLIIRYGHWDRSRTLLLIFLVVVVAAVQDQLDHARRCTVHAEGRSSQRLIPRRQSQSNPS